jgi:hypothetical protein
MHHSRACFSKEAFDDYAVAPLAIELRMAAIGPEDAKSSPLMKPQASMVFGEDAGQQFPKTARFICLDEHSPKS